MKSGRKKGSLLFETFVAVLILSIGVASALQVLSQAVWVGSRTSDQKQAMEGLNGLLFDWFANPEGMALPEAGSMTIPLDSEHRSDDFSAEVESQQLSLLPQTPVPIPGASKPSQSLQKNQYYNLHIQARRNNKPAAMALETLVFQSKKAQGSKP